MRQFTDKIYHLAHSFIQYTSLVLTGLFLLSGVLSTAYSVNMESQEVLYRWDNLLLTIPGSFFLGLIFYALSRFFASGSANRQKVLRILVLAWYVGLNLILFVFSKTAPSGDSYSVYSIAENLAMGNTSVIHPTDSYISYYPQQVGLVAFWEALIRLWKLLPTSLHAYHFIKLVNTALGCVIILFQEKTVHLLWKDEKADCLYLILAGASCPLIMYASFIYGEIPSFAALSVGLYLLLKLLTKDATTEITFKKINSSWLLCAAGSIFLLTVSVMLRKNSLIFIIAILIVVLLQALKKKRYSLLLFAVCCMVCALSILPAIEKYYELRSGNSISSGVTATSYFAMGMQEGPRAKGWYNGFNFETYQDSGMNAEKANALSREAIAERLSYFRENPGYAASFYLEKYLSQWTDGSYACRQATLATAGGRRDFFIKVYEGEYSHYVIAYCNLYQNLMYLGAFAFCFNAVRKKREDTLPAYIGLIAVLGGFLFHMLWEANSRYIFLYGLTLLPFAAKGLSSFSTGLSSWLSTKISLKHR